MTISGEPFIQVHIDFTGKNTAEAREEYLEDLADLLDVEYQDKIKGRKVEYFYQVDSYLNNIPISEWELEAFDMKLQAIRIEKAKQSA